MKCIIAGKMYLAPEAGFGVKLNNEMSTFIIIMVAFRIE